MPPRCCCCSPYTPRTHVSGRVVAITRSIHTFRGAPLLTQYLTPSHLVRAYQSVHLSRVSSSSEPETSVLTTDSRRALSPLLTHCSFTARF